MASQWDLRQQWKELSTCLVIESDPCGWRSWCCFIFFIFRFRSGRPAQWEFLSFLLGFWVWRANFSRWLPCSTSRVHSRVSPVYMHHQGLYSSASVGLKKVGEAALFQPHIDLVSVALGGSMVEFCKSWVISKQKPHQPS